MLRIKEYKALARENLIGRYGTLIGAYFVSLIINGLFTGAAAVCGLFAFKGTGLAGQLKGRLGSIAAALSLESGEFSFPHFMIGMVGCMILLFLSFVVSHALKLGRDRLMLNICRGRKYGIGDVFSGLRSGAELLRYIFAGIFTGILLIVFTGIPALLSAVLGAVGGLEPGRLLGVRIGLVVIFLLVLAYLVTRFFFLQLLIADREQIRFGRALSDSGRMMKGRKFKAFWMFTFSFLLWYLLISVCNVASLWVFPYIDCTKAIFYLDADDSLWQLPGAKRRRTAAANVPAAGPAPEPASDGQAESASATEETTDSTPENAPAGTASLNGAEAPEAAEPARDAEPAAYPEPAETSLPEGEAGQQAMIGE